MARYCFYEVCPTKLHLVLCAILFYLLVNVLFAPFCDIIPHSVQALNPADRVGCFLRPDFDPDDFQVVYFANQRPVSESLSLGGDETFFIKLDMGLVASDRFDLLGIFFEFGSWHFGFFFFGSRFRRRSLVTGLEVHGPDFGLELRNFSLDGG